MPLLDAQPYDSSRDHRRHIWIAAIAMVVILSSWTAYHYRNYPQRKAVAQFFQALQEKHYEQAYGMWFNDPDWQKHPDKYKDYSYSDFYRDWGPGGEWGLIKTSYVTCSLSVGNGVIVQLTVNNRLEHPNVWVDKSDKTFTFPPNEIQCGNWWGWLSE